MKNNKVSIIIPYYNSSIYLLRKCLNSCLNQTYNNTEIILLIDGSPNDISGVVKEIDNNNKIKLVKSDANLGVSKQRNLGLEMASGDYILFVDSDDYIELDAIEKSVSKMDDNIDLVIFGVLDKYYDCVNGLFDQKVFLSFPSKFCRLQYTNFVWNKIFKLKIIKDKKIKFKEDTKLGEDALFCQEYIKNIRYIRCIPDRLYHYIPSDGSATRKFDRRFSEYEYNVINSIKNNFTNYKLCENEIDYLYHWLFLKIKYVFNYYYSGYISKQISENDLSKYFRDIVSKYNIFTYGIVCTDGKYFTKHEYKVLKKLLRSDQSALKAIKKERLEKKISAQKISILKTSIDK